MIRCRYCNSKVDFLGHDCPNNNRNVRWKTRKNRRTKTEQGKLTSTQKPGGYKRKPKIKNDKEKNNKASKDSKKT